MHEINENYGSNEKGEIVAERMKGAGYCVRGSWTRTKTEEVIEGEIYKKTIR